MNQHNQRVRVPNYPIYKEVRPLIKIWRNRSPTQITGLQNSISRITGTPQNPADWKDPVDWIQKRLTGDDQKLANVIWINSNGVVNPRYIVGHWQLVNTYNLMEVDENELLQITESGRDFLDNQFGKVEMELDEQEGIVKILAMLSKNSPSRPGELLPIWTKYILKYSTLRTDSTFKYSLQRRMPNLLDRDLIRRIGNRYTISETGREYFQKFDYQDDLITGSHSDQVTDGYESQEPVRLVTTLSETTEYSLDEVQKEGCFLDEDKLNLIHKRLTERKNLILQGPPGTGKTWLAKRMAYALIGKKDKKQVRIVQFHPNLSYEDFIRGWRPGDKGSLKLVDGPFMEMINAAKNDPDSKYVFVIEEINRGNPAHIFGEMLTLLETDKRNAGEAMELTYGQKGDLVFVPENLYVIGTMNVADRSIAMVDYALRRRFAFIDLVPTLNDKWKNWVHGKFGIDKQFLDEIARRMNELNDQIAEDPSLGAQFKLGHSFVTPSGDSTIENANEWFNHVVETEIGPILSEYWYGDLAISIDAINRLSINQ